MGRKKEECRTLEAIFMIESLAVAMKESLNKPGPELFSKPIESLKDKIPDFKINETGKIKRIPTINEHLDGSRHLETDVPYKTKIVENNQGNLVEGVFPDFTEHSKFEIKLPDTLLEETDNKQFKHCNEELKNAYESKELKTDGFSTREVEQIKNGDKPEGHTWHHNEEKGIMELIPRNTHALSNHTGGKNIWGGGSANR